MLVSRLIILKVRNVWDKICRENENTHFICSTFFVRKSRHEIKWKSVVERGGAQILKHGACALHAGWRRLQTHAQNTQYVWLSTATMVSRTHLNVNVTRALPSVITNSDPSYTSRWARGHGIESSDISFFLGGVTKTDEVDRWCRWHADCCLGLVRGKVFGKSYTAFSSTGLLQVTYSAWSSRESPGFMCFKELRPDIPQN